MTPALESKAMTTSGLTFLKRLLDTPGPSGFETAPARAWREEVMTFADVVKADVHGNSIAALNAKGAPRLMLAGHIDEIGLQITHVDDDGYLYFAGIGGWDPQVLVGQRVVIAGPKGPVRGVIGKQAIHLMKKEDVDKVSKITDLWIDIGAAHKAEALERVQVGDPAVLDAGVQELPNGRIVSRSIDNRIGAYVVAEVIRLLSRDRPSTRPCLRSRPPGRRSRGRGAVRAPAPWASIPRSRSWWTSRTPPTIRARRRSAPASTSSAGGRCWRAAPPSAPSCTICWSSARSGRRFLIASRPRRTTPAPTPMPSTTRCAGFPRAS